MSRIKLDKEKILKKFKTLSVTALSIQKTSKYMYQFSKSSDVIVSLWYQALCSASEAAKISLFYVANEMLQSRNFGSNNFKISWKPKLVQSLDLIKNVTIVDKIIRMFNIWIERRVYDQSFIEDLISTLNATRTPVINEEEAKIIILNFDPEDTIDKLKNLIKIESGVNETLKHIDINTLNFDEKSCKEAIKKLKDKVHCNEFSNQLDGTINQLFQMCSLMEEEFKVRQSTLKIMENAEIYYQTQLSETLIVEDAYKRYGNLISKTKDALEEHLDFLMDDSGPLDIDDAPSPGKTPPYLYDDTVKNVSDSRNSPMSFQDVVSPTQSMDMSEDDTPMDSTVYSNKPYSPSHEVEPKTDSNLNTATTSMEETKTSLSTSDALKILTSVFTQSMTKKVTPESDIRVHLQPDIFRNTLSNSSLHTDAIDNNTNINNNNNNNKSENQDSVVADAFRYISNLTGIKNIGDRNYKSETTTSSGTTIPILTSKNSFRNVSNEPEKLKPNLFPFNQSNYPNLNVSTKCDTMPHTIFPDVQNSFPSMFNQHANTIFPILTNHSGIPTQPPPPMFNPLTSTQLAFNMNVINKDNNQSNKKSPGSCTEDEDEGGATPTQDEPVIHQNSTIFNQNVIPVFQPNTEDINKQIQNVMNATNPFNLSTMLSSSTDSQSNNAMQPSQWSQFPFNMKNPNVQTPLNMPFNLLNQNPPVQPSFSPGNNSKAPMNYGPPRAIRTKRPNTDTGTNQNNETYNLPGSADFNISPPPPPPPKSADEVLNTSQTEDNNTNKTENESKNNAKEPELLNLYDDVEEELDRNYNNFTQQNINVRNSRPPPPSDRYHLYNQSVPQNIMMNYRFNNDTHNNNNNANRMQNTYQHSPYTNSNYRNQFPRGNMMYFPNRTTNFRPRHNYNMFN